MNKIRHTGLVTNNLKRSLFFWNKILKFKIKKYIRENVPTNSFGNLDDIFNVCYMISESSGYISGSLFKIDGGQTLSV